MKITYQSWKNFKNTKELLVVFAFAKDPIELLGIDSAKEKRDIEILARADGFKGKELSSLLVRPQDQLPAERMLLVGLGKKEDLNDEVVRKSMSRAIRTAESLELSRISIRCPEFSIQTMVEGLCLASYRYDKHKSPSKETPSPIQQITLYSQESSAIVQEGIRRGELFSEATCLARNLINEPPSRMNPEILGNEAQRVVKTPLRIHTYQKKELEKLGMGAILGVGVGSAVSPRLVEIIYKPAKARKVIALVGKGITFDSGGLSLKPAQSMETMKDDMSGAAAVLGVMIALPQLKLDVEVRGYLAIAENMPGGRAQKPGDVVKAFNGKTIEVLNTDAEGRLVLADALSFAASKKPDQIIDIATLTGACVVALGGAVSALMTNHPKMIQDLITAGIKAGEKFWELPLIKEYQPYIRSKIADLQNIGSKRGEAGTIIGGLFLQEFVGETPWVHMDIAGPSWVDSDQPYCPTGGTGHPVRTLLHYLENL